MEHHFHFVRMSNNAKLGGLPATTSSKSTCPDKCSFRIKGCYGLTGPISWHWNKLEAKGTDLKTHCSFIRELPLHQLYRLWQVGDFPGDRVHLDADAMRQLVSANRGKHGFGFSHYDPTIEHNAQLFKWANENGLTINLSAESLIEADTYADLGVAPVVVALPIDADNLKTPKGRTVMVCPNSRNKKVTCARCGLCAVPSRNSIIGFPAHGNQAGAVEAIFWAKQA